FRGPRGDLERDRSSAPGREVLPFAVEEEGIRTAGQREIAFDEPGDDGRGERQSPRRHRRADEDPVDTETTRRFPLLVQRAEEDVKRRFALDLAAERFEGAERFRRGDERAGNRLGLEKTLHPPRDLVGPALPGQR